jgi:hypothetical protein
MVQDEGGSRLSPVTTIGSHMCATFRYLLPQKKIVKCGQRTSVHWKPMRSRLPTRAVVTGLSPAEYIADSSWKEVEAAPDVSTFERAGDKLQTPNLLKLGPSMVTAVE